MVITDELRDACEWIAGRSMHVRVVESQIDAYAAELVAAAVPGAAPASPPALDSGARETEAAYWLTLDAINFGSGWFPTLRKTAQRTGYRTIAAGVRRRFDASGRWTPAQLCAVTQDELALWLGQEVDHPLIALFEQSLHDLGENVRRLYGSSFAAVVEAEQGSALRLVQTLAQWRCFADVSQYEGLRVPFLKRAQIAAADLHRAGAVSFGDLGRLTMFADNLVPHVLRLDGVLWFSPELVTRIERGELIEHDSPEEIEIRACAVHAVELIVAAAAEIAAPAPPAAAVQPTTAAAQSAAPAAGRLDAVTVDELLWNRGQQPQYKAVPRHRSRSTAY